MAQQVKNQRPMYVKANAIDDERARKAWMKQRTHCAACGISKHDAPRRDAGLPLSCHHVIRGLRSDEPTNWLCCCARCHGLIHDDQVRIDGVLVPKLTLGVILTVKSVRHPNEYDAVRLAALFGRACLPDLLPIPDFYEAEYRKRRPSPYLPWPGYVEPVDGNVEVYDHVTHERTVVKLGECDGGNVVKGKVEVFVGVKVVGNDKRCARCVRLNMRDEKRNCPACLRLQWK
jgi:hypothetical protein